MPFTAKALSSKWTWLGLGVLAIAPVLLIADRGCACVRPDDTPAAYAAAARSALREIRTAQEIHAATNDYRYAASLAEIADATAELARRLEPALDVTAAVTGDASGEWYAAEVGHRLLPGWRCRYATEGAPAVASGALAPNAETCDPLPESAARPDVENAGARS